MHPPSATAAGVLAVLLTAAVAAQEVPPEATPSPLHRALEAALEQELQDVPEADPEEPAAEDAGPLVLELHSGDGAPSVLEELTEELRDAPTSPGGRVEAFVAEQVRELGFGGLVGASGMQPGLDVVALARAVGGLLRSPPAEDPASFGSHSMDLLVREPDGSPPPTVRVTVTVGGVTGPTRTLSCEAGRCRLDGLPSGPFTLLVRGSGARVVDLPAWSPEIVVRLRPDAALSRPDEVAPPPAPATRGSAPEDRARPDG